jgi:molecular chaperone DnaJ
VVAIELEDAFSGTTVSAPIEVAVSCERCDASGAEPGTGSRSCPTCNGVGVVRSVSQNIFGQFVQQRACPDCDGAGEVLEQPCSECRGDGRVLTRTTVEVDVPAGIHDGQQIRVRGGGHAGFRSEERGNAFVVVRVRPDPRFVRDGDDLHTAVRLTMTDAALGTTATVASLSGTVELEVPPGTQPGAVRVLKGQGMPALRSGRRGSLHVRLDVAVPTALDPDQRRLVEELDQSLGADAYVDTDDGEGFFSRLRSALR